MADLQGGSSRRKNPSRPGRVGSARQRQNQRVRSKELRQSLAQAVSPDGLRSGLKRRPSQRSAAGTNASKIEGGRPSRTDSRRSTSRRVIPTQPVVNVSSRSAIGSRSKPLLANHRPHNERRAATTNQAKMPPVLVRGGMPDMAVRRPKQSLPKRRYDVALDVPGAELHLPSLPAVRVGWRALSGTMAVMMIACLFLMWKSPAFLVNTVEAEGLERLTVGDLNTVMDILGGSIFTIDPPAVEQLLRQSFPELAEVTVNTGLPARVSINVVERQPVLSWFQDNREVWVDGEGVTFMPRGNPGTLVRVEGHGITPAAIAAVVIPAAGSLPPGTIYVPAVTQDGAADGEEMVLAQPERLPVELVQAILTLGSQVPAETQLVYDGQYGLGWEDPLGWEVYFGYQTSEMEQRLVVYQGVVQYLTHQGLQPELVSVEFVHAPYYRMER
jgi:cell division protein FtsQ